jgi:hypothetical protein
LRRKGTEAAAQEPPCPPSLPPPDEWPPGVWLGAGAAGLCDGADGV